MNNLKQKTNPYRSLGDGRCSAWPQGSCRLDFLSCRARVAAFCLLFAGLYCFLSPQMSQSAELPPDLKGIIERGKIVVAMFRGEAPPFFMRDSHGDMFGYDIELAQDLAARLGVALEWDKTADTYDQVIELVATGKADIGISALSKTLFRARFVRFSEPYVILRQALMLNRLLAARSNIAASTESLQSHKGTTIAVVEGSAYVDFAKDNFPTAEIVHREDWNEAVQDVLSGKFLLAFSDELSAYNWSRKNPESAVFLKTIILEDSKDTIAFAVAWNRTHFLSWLNLYLEKIRSDGTEKKLRAYYLESDQWRRK